MKFGFISDIHGNYQGLRIALFHLKILGCEIVCLGDLVSENSEENEKCVQLIKKMGIQSVKGQHDDTCTKCDFPPVSQDSRSFLKSLPEMMKHENILCVHDNPLERARDGQGMWNNGSYIWSPMEASMVFEDFFNNQSSIRFIFVGHTHAPKVFSNAEEVKVVFNQPLCLSRDHHYIINPGNIGGVQRDINTDHTYLLFDQEAGQLIFFRSNKEGREFRENCLDKGEKQIQSAIQQSLFIPYQHYKPNLSIESESKMNTHTDSSLMFHVLNNLSVCGYSGIPPIEGFTALGFKAHLQCTDGFEDLINNTVDVKCLPFEDCKPIPSPILKTAFNWLEFHWDKGHRVLISCAAGESRSVSVAIGLVTLKTELTFMDACEKVFSAIPPAYPHPKTLVSVAEYFDYTLNLDQLNKIYNTILVPPPFPWTKAELVEALV